MKRLQQLKEQEKQAITLIESNKTNDPKELQRIKSGITSNKEAVNRWTDNIWTIKKFLTRKRGLSSSEVCIV